MRRRRRSGMQCSASLLRGCALNCFQVSARTPGFAGRAHCAGRTIARATHAVAVRLARVAPALTDPTIDRELPLPALEVSGACRHMFTCERELGHFGLLEDGR